MTVEEAVAMLDSIPGADPELAHYNADTVLRAMVDREIADAYDRVVSRCRWWAHA